MDTQRDFNNDFPKDCCNFLLCDVTILYTLKIAEWFCSACWFIPLFDSPHLFGSPDIFVPTRFINVCSGWLERKEMPKGFESVWNMFYKTMFFLKARRRLWHFVCGSLMSRHSDLECILFSLFKLWIRCIYIVGKKVYRIAVTLLYRCCFFYTLCTCVRIFLFVFMISWWKRREELCTNDQTRI